MSTTAPKRGYDATRRRERAEVEREATRKRIIEAARDLFVEQGYVETTVDAIAARAGVVKQTVYLAAGSKAQLLRAVEKQNGDMGWPVIESDPKKQVALIAAHLRAVAEPAAPVWKAMREAAAVDAEVSAYVVRAGQLRYAELLGVARLLPASALRDGVGYNEAADTIAALGSPETAEMLVNRRGWSFDQYERWLADALDRLLLA
jgi:AcrR family transcriptional regulator